MGTTVLSFPLCLLLLVCISFAHGGPIDCGGDHFMVKDHTDAASLSTCTEVRGLVKIADSFEGDLNLDGLEIINGDLVTEDALNITKFTSKSLQRVANIKIKNASSLSTITLNHLDTAESLILDGCPALRIVQIPQSLSISELNIHGVGLRVLELNIPTVQNLFISTSSSLDLISLPITETVSDAINISNNGVNLVLELPALTQARSFSSTNGPAANYGWNSRYAHPLQKVHPALKLDSLVSIEILEIDARIPIEALYLRALYELHRLQIVGTVWSIEMTGLRHVSHLFAIDGNIESLYVYNLASIHGWTVLVSQIEGFDCFALDRMRQQGLIKGSYDCKVGEKVSWYSDENQHRQRIIWGAFGAALLALCSISLLVLYLVRKYRVKGKVTRQAVSHLRNRLERTHLLQRSVDGIGEEDDFGELKDGSRAEELQTDGDAREMSEDQGPVEINDRSHRIGHFRESDDLSLHELSETSTQESSKHAKTKDVSSHSTSS